MDFKDFAKNYNTNSESQNINKSDMEKAQDVINKYSNYSESELASELAKTIKQQKNNNLYNREKVMEQINMLSSYLTLEQQQKIKDMLLDAENK